MSDWLAYGSIALGAVITSMAALRFVVDFARARRETGTSSPEAIQRSPPTPSKQTSIVRLVIIDAAGTILIAFGLIRLFL